MSNVGQGGLVNGVILAADTMEKQELLDTVLRLERLGYDEAWVTDMYGREIYATAAWLLAKTSRIRIASGIAHIYGRDAVASAQAGRTLSELSGGRFVQGVGVSHPIAATMRGLEWENPIDKASSYLSAMRGETPLNIRASSESVPLYLAAHGPKMLGVAARYADGANIYMQMPEYMDFARSTLGPDKVLNVVLPCCLTTDREVGLAAGRAALSIYLPLPAYQRQWAKQGFDESDWAGKGSDRLVESYVPWGDAETITDRMRQYLDAGATNIIVSSMPTDRRNPDTRWGLLEVFAPFGSSATN
jgi:probable F420-dependent oxidoreductase